MTTTSLHPDPDTATRDDHMWTLAGTLLDALARRDFPAMAGCLASDVRFRALVPRGPLTASGPNETTDHFRRWFGGEDEFEVVDASIGQVGRTLYLRWRVRLQENTGTRSARIAEQHIFAAVGASIESMDLLCSGFQRDA